MVAKREAFSINKISYKTLLLIVVSLLIGIILLWRYVLPKNKASAAWWNDGWNYRKAISISNTSGSNLTDFQVSLTIGTSALIAEGKMQSDCDDIRLTDINGNLLPYWIDSDLDCNNISDTVIYTNVTLIPTSSTIVYFYYGNNSASDNQNGASVYPQLFDSFDGATINNDKYSYAGGNFIQNNSVSIVNDADAWDTYFYKKTLYPRDPSSVFYAKIKANSATRSMIGWHDGGSGISHADLVYAIYFDNGVFRIYEDGAQHASTAGSYTPGTWYNIKIELKAVGAKYYYKEINTNIWTLLYDSSYSSESNLRPGIAHFDVSQYSYIDDWRIGKYSPVEPSIVLQPEETGGGPVAYWKFDEGAGTTVYDSSTKENNGIINETTWKNNDQCISEKCLDFPASGGGYITINSSDTLNFNTNSFTVSSWVYLRDYTYPKSTFMIRKEGNPCYSAGNPGFYIGHGYMSNGSRFCINDGTNFVDSSIVFDLGYRPTDTKNKWTYFTYVFDRTAGKIRVYINGKKQFNELNISSVTGSIDNTSTIYIGNVHGWQTDGKYDDLKIYPYARTEDQIKKDYNSRGTISGSSANLSTNSNNQSLTDGLVAYWKMDEGIGTSIIDLSGNNYTGTFGTGNSSPAWSNGKYGVGVSFDGSDYIEGGDILNMGTNDMTISVWVKTSNSSSTGQYILSKSRAATQNYRYGLSIINGNARLFMQGDGGVDVVIDGVKSVSDGNWHNLTAIFDRDNYASIYVDGIYDTGQTISQWNGKNMISTNPFRIGTYTAADNVGIISPFLGSIDEIRIYNRTLSPSEVSQLYEYAPDPLFYWDFNERIGTTAIDKQGHTNLPITIASYTSGKYGAGLSFNGNSWLEKAISPTIAAGQDYTQCLWFNPSTAAKQILIDDSNQWEHWIGLNTDRTISGCYYNAGQICATSANHVNLNTWNYVCLTYKNGQSLDLNVNGSSWATSTNIGTTISKIYDDICIGSAGGSAHNEKFTGKIDEVKVYNYARTQKQIIEDMNAGAPTTSSKSILAYYKFDEGTGSTTNNFGNLGTGYNGVLQNGPSWINESKFNKGLWLDGLNDYIEVASNNALKYKGGDLTLSVWFKPDSSDDGGRIISKPWNGSGQYNYGIFSSGGSNPLLSINLVGSSSYTLSFNKTIPSNRWSHILATIDGATDQVKLYINGNFVNSGIYNILNWTPSAGDNNLPLSFGTLYPYGGSWSGVTSHAVKGFIDEVKIYNYVLADEEIKQDYNKGSAFSFGSTSQTIGNTTTSLEYCIPGDTSYCASPIAEYKMDERTGTTINDTSGNNNNGTFGTGNSAPTWTTGKIGAGINFDGVNDTVSAANIKPTNFSASMWIYPTSYSNQPYVSFLSNRSSAADGLMLFTYDGNSLNFDWGDGGNSHRWNTGYQPPLNQWTFLTVSRDGNGRYLYINGVLKNSTTDSGGPITTNNNLDIGWVSAGGPYHFQGKMDQIRIYDYARTPAQVAYDYNKGGPVGWWKFDECQGNISRDSSGIGNTGIINIGTSGSQNSLGTCAIGASAAWTNGAIGKFNSSLYFDGVDDYVDFGDINQFDGLNSITVSVWVYSTNFNQNGMIIMKNPVNSVWELYLESSKIRWRGGGAGVTLVKNLPSNNQWHNIVVTQYGTLATMFIDGINLGSANVNALGSSSSSVNIGRYGSNAYCFNGNIDDVRIYNYALTPEQIKILFNGGAVNFN